ncbi:MAG TPA: hypothetical protein VK190_03080 [Pseudoneobacillus sp.]|nr:hypothetical protein [Pseudoneobacillus sp.]
MAISRFNPDQINSKSIDGTKLVDDITLGGGLKLTTSLTNLTGSYTSSINLNNGIAITSNGPSYINGSKVGIRTASPDANYDVTIAGNTYISGNLNVSGSLNYTSSETVQITDNILLLNSNWTTAASEDAGLEVERGTYTNAKLTWNETNNYWTISNPADDAGAYSSYRIVDQNYGDGRYMAIGNTSFSGALTIATTTDEIMTLKQTGGGWNYLGFYSDKVTPGTWVRKAYIGMGSDDTIFAIKAEDTNGYISLNNNVTITGNITLSTANATVDGVDISAHAANATAHHSNANDPSTSEKAALAGTSGTPGSTNKYVTDSDSRMTNKRDPNTHGDSAHNTLSYFKKITDGAATPTEKSAGGTNNNIKFAASGASSVAISGDTSYDAIVTYTSVNNYLTSVSGTAGGTITFKQSGLSDITWDSSHTHAYLPLAGGTVTGNAALQGTTTFGSNGKVSADDTGITFDNKQGTTNAYPSAKRGFSWSLTSDKASMYAMEKASDSVDYVFAIGDNLNQTDRYVWKAISWTGHHADYEMLEMSPGNATISRQRIETNGSLTLKVPQLGKVYRGSRVDSQQAMQQTTIVRNDGDYFDPNLNGSTLTLSVDCSGYNRTDVSEYLVKIKTGGATQNTYCWGRSVYVAQSTASSSGWTGYNINASTSWVDLGDGIKIQFNATTGGVADETFGFTVLPGGGITVEGNYNSVFNGPVGIKTSSPSKELEVTGTIKINDTGVSPNKFILGDDNVYLIRDDSKVATASGFLTSSRLYFTSALKTAFDTSLYRSNTGLLETPNSLLVGTKLGVGTATATVPSTYTLTVSGSSYLDAASAATYNKVTITAPANGSTLTIADAKTLTVSNTITLSAAKDSVTLNINNGGTLGSAAFTDTTAYEPAIANGAANVVLGMNSAANSKEWKAISIGTSGTAPAVDLSTAGKIVINIPAASTTSVTAGTISKSDYDAFNAKQSALTFSSGIVNTSGTVTPSYGTAANTICQGNDSRLSDSRTPKAHTLVDTTGHTVSGLTAGQVLRASGATTYAFAQLNHGDLGSVSADQHHAQVHDINGTDHSGTPLKVGKGGTGLTAVTAGYIPFGSTADALNTSSNLFWDTANNRLGIGTSSPANKVEIIGTTGSEELMLASNSDGTGARHGIAFRGSTTNVEARIKSGNFGSYYGGLIFEVHTDIAASTATVQALIIDNNKKATFAGAVDCGNISTSGNITLSTTNATVDGRDVSADGAKVDTLETIRSKRGRAAIVTSAAIAQDTATTLSTLGISGLSWDASKSIVLVNVEGSLQVQDVDVNNQFDYSISSTDTITFHYDIPVSSVIEIIVL